MVPGILLALALAGPLPDAGPEPAAGCRLALKKGIGPIEKLPMAKRLEASLALLSRSCPAELGELVTAASAAAALPRAERAKKLASAAASSQAPCATRNPTAPAGPLLRVCPPAKLQLDVSVGKDLDAGTYLFVLAAERRLVSAGAFDQAAERVLSILVLSAALEGAAAR